MQYTTAPEWLRNANNHSVGSSGVGFLEGIGASLSNTPEFLFVSGASALNSFYNTGVSLGNIVRAEEDKIRQRDTYEFIYNYDEDLGAYYRQNQGAADLTGFIAGSIIPGTLAVKALNYGQKSLRAAKMGEFGAHTSLSTRLLAPTVETYVQREAAMLAGQSAAFSFRHVNSLKSIAAGAQQGLLEGLAFETAVVATMYKSPILEGMDVWDIMQNGLIGVGLGAGVGGLVGAGRAYFGSKALAAKAEARSRIFTGTNATQTSSSMLPSDKLVIAAAELRRLTDFVPTSEWVTRQKQLVGETGASLAPDAIQAEVNRLGQLRNDEIQRLGNELRTGLRKLVDPQAGTAVGKKVDSSRLALTIEAILGKGQPDDMRDFLFNLKEITRAGKKTDFDAAIKAKQQLHFEETGKKLSRKKAEAAMANWAEQHYIRLWGGEIGEKIQGSPGYMRIADRLTEQQIANRIGQKGQFKYGKGNHVDFRVKQSPDTLELRYLAARRNAVFVAGKQEILVGTHDLAVLQAALDNGFYHLKLESGELLNSPAKLKEHLRRAQDEVVEAWKGHKARTDTIEAVANVRKDYLEGRINPDKADDLDTWYDAQTSYAKELSAKLYDGDATRVTPVELMLTPSLAKTVYSTRAITDETGMILKGMAQLKQRQKLAQQDTDRIVAKILGPEFGAIVPEADPGAVLRAHRGEGGSGFFTNAGGEYGSYAQRAAYLGDIFAEIERKRVQQLSEEVTQEFSQILAKNPEAALQFEGISTLASKTPDQYVLNETGTSLIPAQTQKYHKLLAAGEDVDPPELHPNTLEEIPLPSEDLQKAVKFWITKTDALKEEADMLKVLDGYSVDEPMGAFRPVRADPRTHRYVLFVRDNTVTGSGETSMVFAESAEALRKIERQILSETPYQVGVKPSQSLFTYNRQQAEEWKKALGEYEYERTLRSNSINEELQRKGVMVNYFPKTDVADIINSAYQQLVRKSHANLRGTWAKKYQAEVETIRQFANQWDQGSKSIMGSMTPEEILLSKTANPYQGLLKSMFNITKTEEYPLVNTLQQKMDRIVSEASEKAQNLFLSSTKNNRVPTEADIEKINSAFESIGLQSAYTNAALELLKDSKVPRGTLTKFVRAANAFLQTTILRWDPFNALNNTVGNAILYSAEYRQVLADIKRGNAAAVGDLAKLQNIVVPGTGGDEIGSVTKLFSNSLKRLLNNGEASKALIAQYKARGLLPDMTEQLFKALDPLTLTGTETVTQMSSKYAKLMENFRNWGNTGEKWTGNKWAEQFNRLLAADAMKQITEVAVKHGIMDEKVAWQYIATASKRINGVIRAAERPGMFQGPIGQAIGLFQSYQINLLQQLFRHVGEGNKKTLAIMAGVQSTVYGASSLPGFNLINHQLAMAEGNPEHYDLHSAAYTMFGKEGAEWLMYGAPSNLLNSAIFSRGNTNPRWWHVVPNPTKPMDIPIISSFAKAAGAIKQGFSNVSNGTPAWEAMLGGLEHSGISRPLAGFAAVARAAANDGTVISTQANGAISGSNDFLTWASLSRVLGAKPLDEAIVTNSYFRITAYAAADRQARENLGVALKRSFQQNDFADVDVAAFAEAYVGRGGSQTGFNQWFMNQYMNANQSQALQLSRELNSPYARRMQEVMGGRESLFDTSW